MNEKNTTQRAAARLLNFVKSHDPVARSVGDGSCVQVVRPDLDLYGDFIRLGVERHKTKLLVHDGAFTLGCLNSLDADNLAEINAVLADYGVGPLDEETMRIQVRSSRADYPERREALCRAVVAVERLLQG